MDPALLQAWDAEQVALAARVVESDPPDGALSIGGPGPDPGPGRRKPLRLVGGLDISFDDDGDDDDATAVAALVLLSFPELEVVHEAFARVALTQPYAAGYLAFREAPALIGLVEGLRGAGAGAHLWPDVLMVDGNGVLHPRGCGLACHVGLATGVPTIGVAKTFHHVDGLDAHGVRRAVDALPRERGDWLPLVGQSGRTWGAALRPCSQHHPASTSDSDPGGEGVGVVVRNPIYVSVGTGLSLETAVRVVRACCRHRVPEPVRQADIRSRARIREEGRGRQGSLGAAAERGKKARPAT